MNKVYYVGLDVHKDSIQMAVLDDRKKEPIVAKGLPNPGNPGRKRTGRVPEAGGSPDSLRSGVPYTLYRELSAFGFDRWG
jgi:hypothetical protein